MFFHIFKYRIKQIFHEKELILWVFTFPILLGTLFYASFGHLIGGDSNNFKAIPIALVSEANANSTFENVLNELSRDNENQMFEVTSVTKDEAMQLLEDTKVDGIIYSTATPTVMVSKEGTNQSIIESFIDQYIQQEYMIKEIVTSHPEKLTEAISLMSKDIDFNKDVSLTDSVMDSELQYFYALIAMACMYGSIIGLDTVIKSQANLSPLGARREVSPTHKLIVIFGDFSASVVVNYMSLLLLYFYLIVILGLDFGPKIPLVLISTFFGSVIGVATGIFVGAIGKWGKSTKDAIVMGYSMICCFLGGLMINTMKDIIEHLCPIINRINPAALITDCLYSLNMFDTYNRFLADIAIMGFMAFILCFASFLLLRRNKYASI